jgi:hypothetical protein
MFPLKLKVFAKKKTQHLKFGSDCVKLHMFCPGMEYQYGL